MTGCVASSLGSGLEIRGPGGAAGYTITDNVIRGGTYNITFSSGSNNVTCERNIFSESTINSVRITNCLPRIHNNHIIKGDGYSVEMVGTVPGIYPTLQQLDMSNNYWGTTEADSISAWIYDANDVDNSDCFADVVFEPFFSEPTPDKKTSLGSLKAMFR
jgi:hypothetical protein